MRVARAGCHYTANPTAPSLRVVGIKATPTGRAEKSARESCAWRDLDAAERTRTTEAVAAPEIVAQSYGSPEIDGSSSERERMPPQGNSRCALQRV